MRDGLFQPLLYRTNMRALPAWLSLSVCMLACGCSRGSRDAQLNARTEREEPRTASPRMVPAAFKDGGNALAEVAERALPSVVSVASTRLARVETPGLPFDDPFFRRFFGPDSPLPFPSPPGEAPEQRGLGSGVIVGPNLVLTNAHVVEGAERLEITARDRRTLGAEVVGSDPKSDLALLRLTGDTSGLSALEFADSAQARLGQVVLAIGNPFGVGQTVTMGIVSAVGRANLGIVDYEDFIQTDAAINPGNSGGALVDMSGKLVGIPTAILSRTGGYMGVGFAIPSNMAKPIMDSLLKSGRVTRGFLGVSIQDIDQYIAKAFGLPNTSGVLVADVSADGPAAKAGLRRGDVILSVSGRPVNSTGELRNAIAASGVGKRVAIEILRGNDQRKIDVTLGEMPGGEAPGAQAPGAAPSAAAGLSVAPLDPDTRKRLNVPAEVGNGVVVTRVEPGSPAAKAGVRAGDVILEVDKQPVQSPARLAELWSQAQGPTAMLILREGRTSYVVLER